MEEHQLQHESKTHHALASQKRSAHTDTLGTVRKDLQTQSHWIPVGVPKPSLMHRSQVFSARTLFCTLSPRQNTIMIRSNTSGYATKRGGCPCKVRRRHRHTRGAYGRQTLLQEPNRASLTYTSPLRRRTFTFHPYIHAELLQTARWRSPSFSIIAKLAPLWTHRSGQSLPTHRKQLSRTYTITVISK